MLVGSVKLLQDNKKKLKCFDLCGRTSRTHGMLKNTSMDRASMGYLASSKDLCWWMWRFCFVSNFSKKIDRCQETLLVWHLSFILKLLCHEVITSSIRLSHTTEVECKSIARDRIRCTRAMKHQMHDINVVDLASQHQCDDKFFKLCRTKV